MLRYSHIRKKTNTTVRKDLILMLSECFTECGNAHLILASERFLLGFIKSHVPLKYFGLVTKRVKMLI